MFTTFTHLRIGRRSPKSLTKRSAWKLVIVEYFRYMPGEVLAWVRFAIFLIAFQLTSGAGPRMLRNNRFAFLNLGGNRNTHFSRRWVRSTTFVSRRTRIGVFCSLAVTLIRKRSGTGGRDSGLVCDWLRSRRRGTTSRWLRCPRLALTPIGGFGCIRPDVTDFLESFKLLDGSS